MSELNLKLLTLNNSPEHNIVLGQSHFIKTVEDIHELLTNSVPNAKFGLAFCEASGERLIRHSGTDQALEAEAIRLAKDIGAGHSFVIVMKDMYPINILPSLKNVPEVVNIYCASANPIQVVVVDSDQGRGILGVIDGNSPRGVESDDDIVKRKQFLRNIGYKG